MANFTKHEFLNKIQGILKKFSIIFDIKICNLLHG